MEQFIPDQSSVKKYKPPASITFSQKEVTKSGTKYLTSFAYMSSSMIEGLIEPYGGGEAYFSFFLMDDGPRPMLLVGSRDPTEWAGKTRKELSNNGVFKLGRNSARTFAVKQLVDKWRIPYKKMTFAKTRLKSLDYCGTIYVSAIVRAD